MLTFNYVAKDASGKTLRGTAQASDRTAVLAQLRSKNLTPVALTEAAPKNASAFSLSFGAKVPLVEVVIFARQLATMIDAGIPILQSLEILSEQTDNKKLREVLKDVAKRVAAGTSINKAIGQHPRVFSDFFIHLIKAGEESGNLDEILDRVAIYLEKSDKLARKVKSAMIYPAVVMTMAISITALMLIKVIPVFADMYSGFKIELPLPTRVLMAMSDGLRANILYILGAGVAAFFAFRMFAKSEAGALTLDRLKLRLPVFGPLIRKVAVSKFTRTLATLLKSGVPILRAIEIVAKTSGNRLLEKVITSSGKAVREGRKLSEPLLESKVFPPMVIRMIAVGETSGELEKMLTKISEFYDDQVDVAVAGLTSLIEPLVIAFLGIVIGGIVISMFMPMFQMAQVVSG
jgi:type IV pilus assembly protein PilC